MNARGRRRGARGETAQREATGIAERIVELRTYWSRSKSAFAEWVGLDRKAVERYEKGVAIPNAESLARIARRTACNVDWLLLGEGTLYPGPIDIRIGLNVDEPEIRATGISPEGRLLLDPPLSVETPADYGKALDAMVGLITEVERDPRVSTRQNVVGVAIPGSLSATGEVKNSHIEFLNGHHLEADLEQASGRKVRLENDADCFALSVAHSQHLDVGPRDPWCIFAVLLSTGVGAGIVVSGRLISGPNGLAGEVGHNRIVDSPDDPRQGRLCPVCGHGDCAELYLCYEEYRRLLCGDNIPDRLDGRQPGVVLYAHRVGRFLGSLVNVLDPDVIALGGRVVQSDPTICTQVSKCLGDYVFFNKRDPTRLATTLVCETDDTALIRGAAQLWSNKDCAASQPKTSPCPQDEDAARASSTS